MKSKVSLNTKIFVDVATHEKIRPDIFFFFAFPSSRFPFESVFFHRFLILLFFFFLLSPQPFAHETQEKIITDIKANMCNVHNIRVFYRIHFLLCVSPRSLVAAHEQPTLPDPNKTKTRESECKDVRGYHVHVQEKENLCWSIHVELCVSFLDCDVLPLPTCPTSKEENKTKKKRSDWC
ncbi:Uncharacterized protein APZ42_026342 [Daphnia magna]|uniref:Uncharacterized protein n=1 Tax=Daphnia magna TaxID=35525 RepID=A0A162EDR4_9CRUS|nr:Uncharacterized protein APZ42_026342 [Daphnia magna]